MRILLVGAGGTIGRAVAQALAARHEVVGVSRSTSPLAADIADPASLRALFAAAGPLDAIVGAAGQAKFQPLERLGDDDFAFSLANKLMGQVNLIRYGLPHLRDGGAIVVTSGVLSRAPTKGSAAISLVNAGLEGFVRAAALEAPRGIRVNVVSPPWVCETLRKLGMDEAIGLPASVVAQAYVRALEGTMTGEVIEPAKG
ncbi:MAG TPA: short chain dehydrogenase [Ideonella sp.]|nr:short chain dehydrogenase [Ideonella sp.]